MRGQVKNTPYPQPEGVLGETMIKHGKDLGKIKNKNFFLFIHLKDLNKNRR